MYCKDDDRRGSHEHERFDFLGYTFRRRLLKNKHGKFFVGFVPAISDAAAKAIRLEIRRWQLHHRSDQDLSDLARRINPVVQGWINYYGRFYRSALYRSLKGINEYLTRWAMRKFKRLRCRRTRAHAWLGNVAGRAPNLFAHWRMGVRPYGWAGGAG